MPWARLRRRRVLGQRGPLDCAAVAAVLQEHLDGELSDDMASRVNDHLEACSRCGLERDTYLAIKDSVARSQRPDQEVLDRLQVFADSVASDPTSRSVADES